MSKGTPASSQIIWMEGRIAELEAECKTLREDAERLDFAESKRSTIYAAYDNGKILHWVFVDEIKPRDRRGALGITIREAIDAAREGK